MHSVMMPLNDPSFVTIRQKGIVERTAFGPPTMLGEMLRDLLQ